MYILPAFATCFLFSGLVGYITKYDSNLSFQLMHAGIVTLILSLLLNFFFGEYEVWMM